MKKIILTLIAGIFIVLGLTACSEKENKNADIIIFTQDGCPHCVSTKTFINGELKKMFPDLTVQEYDVRGGQYEYNLFADAVKRFGFNSNPKVQVGTPLMIIGNEGLMGWDEPNKQKIVNLLKQKKAASAE